jgi:hypothetical protein
MIQRAKKVTTMVVNFPNRIWEVWSENFAMIDWRWSELRRLAVWIGGVSEGRFWDLEENVGGLGIGGFGNWNWIEP